MGMAGVEGGEERNARKGEEEKLETMRDNL